MRNIRFGIDIDGTVTCPTSLLPHINEQFGCSLVLDDITEYDLTEAFPVDKDIFWQWYKGAEAHIYSTSPAQAYAKKVLDDWHTQFELYYISARGPEVHEATVNWFNREEIPYDHIELVGSHHKIATAKKFGVHAFFEDKHDNAVEIHETLNIPVILFDTPYNREPIPEGVIRVNNWQEANDQIKKLFPIEQAVLK
ncbi:5' nucleotidase, NT5C type [Sporosarcina sp. FSL K6-3457]|uniref:5' nucleotidase, NT5C type n=1 Tax=Sporosarcina sp. FSL K6-3457 TaxID=2978204 RepID=UPI0030FBC392